ncbi:MAG: hypothetical protein AB4062_18120 [Crocosphaera sp.]
MNLLNYFKLGNIGSDRRKNSTILIFNELSFFDIIGVVLIIIKIYVKTEAEIQNFYEKIVNEFSPHEQLYLASLILNNLAEKKVMVIDESETWTQEDQNDLVAFSLQYSNQVAGDSEELV